MADIQTQLPVKGHLTNNNAAPAANNVGALVALANAAAPTNTEGDQVLLSTDLAGNLRTSTTLNGTSDVNLTEVGGAPIALGSTTSANSIPVTIATDQGTLDVDVTGDVTVVGNLTHNDSPPAANNVGVLPAVASAAAPTYNEGDQVLLSTDNAGALRVTSTNTGTTDVNLIEVGGAPVALGQTTMANSIPVVLPSDQTVNVAFGEVSTGVINAFFTESAVANGSTSTTLNYTVTAAKTFYLKEIIASASGGPCRVQVDYGAGPTIVCVGFTSTAVPNFVITFPQPIAIAALTVVRIKIQNNAGAAQDVYGTFNGIEV